MSETIVFTARKIITMNPANAHATHVAVREGKILAVGSEEEMTGWGPYDFDRTFENKVLMPGMIEGHCHLMAGGIWNFTYVGYQDRVDPDGKLWVGVKTIEDVIDRLKEVDGELDDGEPLVAWGFDPIFLMEGRPEKTDLDKVSTSRPIAVIHSNFHLMT
ncbi:MAG: hypothetical protein MI743_02160, partial [Sneathiellales bacterium]|nr:hypothetical protein [Sneathiellales bacterium]